IACYELMGPPSARDLARKDGLCKRHPPQNCPADCDEALSSHSFIDQIRGFGLQSSLNSTCLRRCRRAGSSRVTGNPCQPKQRPAANEDALQFPGTPPTV